MGTWSQSAALRTEGTQGHKNDPGNSERCPGLFLPTRTFKGRDIYPPTHPSVRPSQSASHIYSYTFSLRLYCGDTQILRSASESLQAARKQPLSQGSFERRSETQPEAASSFRAYGQRLCLAPTPS